MKDIASLRDFSYFSDVLLSIWCPYGTLKHFGHFCHPQPDRFLREQAKGLTWHLTTHPNSLMNNKRESRVRGWREKNSGNPHSSSKEILKGANESSSLVEYQAKDDYFRAERKSSSS